MSERPAVEPPAAIGELSQGLMLHRSAPGDSAHSMDDTGDITAQRLRELEARISKLEANVKSLAAAYSLARHGTRRIWLRPPLWTFEQHAPRPLRIDADYAREQAPADTPSIGIVTPSLNGGRFLAATVDSVLTQNYPSLRYHVQDGGSTDSSCELLRSYGARLTWRSEPDSGQAQAINRAFAEIGDCDIMAYLNSDDMLLSGTLAYVANVFRADRTSISFTAIAFSWTGRSGDRASGIAAPRRGGAVLGGLRAPGDVVLAPPGLAGDRPTRRKLPLCA